MRVSLIADVLAVFQGVESPFATTGRLNAKLSSHSLLYVEVVVAQRWSPALQGQRCGGRRCLIVVGREAVVVIRGRLVGRSEEAWAESASFWRCEWRNQAEERVVGVFLLGEGGAQVGQLLAVAHCFADLEYRCVRGDLPVFGAECGGRVEGVGQAGLDD